MSTVEQHLVVQSRVPTRVEALPHATGVLVRIHHGDSVIEADSEVLRAWLHEMRSAVPHAVSLAERGAA